MSDDDKTRKLKPNTPIPVEQSAIAGDLPEYKMQVDTAASLLGLKRQYTKRVLRKTFDYKVRSTVTLGQVAEVYSVTRNSPVLSDAHFTTDKGKDGLVSLIEKIELSGDRESELDTDEIVLGSAFDHVNRFPRESVQTIVTSPPYWGMRVYPESFEVEWSDGTSCPYGGEDTPEEYVRHTVEFLLQLRSILKENGTIWWNIGDTYNTRSPIRSSSSEVMSAIEGEEEDNKTWVDYDARRYSSGHQYLKDKDLIGIPYMVADAAQRAGFWVRSMVTWEKRNVVPENAHDRPSNSHEHLLLISKSSSYKFDETPWRENNHLGTRMEDETENLRSVWQFSTASGDGDHAAPFPVELPARCITLSTDEGDLVYDPFMGSGTTGVAAKKLHRGWVGSEISDEYREQAEKRIENTETQRALKEFTESEE